MSISKTTKRSIKDNFLEISGQVDSAASFAGKGKALLNYAATGVSIESCGTCASSSGQCGGSGNSNSSSQARVKK